MQELLAIGSVAAVGLGFLSAVSGATVGKLFDKLLGQPHDGQYGEMRETRLKKYGRQLVFIGIACSLIYIGMQLG